MGTLFTHHQKCVIVDTPASGNNRKISAFIGGLDLCDGRYDTPEHRLFGDLNTVFANDFHNPSLPVSSYCTFPKLSMWLILTLNWKFIVFNEAKIHCNACNMSLSPT